MSAVPGSSSKVLEAWWQHAPGHLLTSSLFLVSPVGQRVERSQAPCDIPEEKSYEDLQEHKAGIWLFRQTVLAGRKAFNDNAACVLPTSAAARTVSWPDGLLCTAQCEGHYMCT